MPTPNQPFEISSSGLLVRKGWGSSLHNYVADINKVPSFQNQLQNYTTRTNLGGLGGGGTFSLDAPMNTPQVTAATSQSRLERAGIIDSLTGKLNKPLTLRALALVKEKFPDLDSIDVHTSYNTSNSPYANRAKANGSYDIGMGLAVNSRTIRLRRPKPLIEE